MIDNYQTDKDGIIHQIVKHPFAYGVDYSANYNKLGELADQMSFLRLGYIIGNSAAHNIPNESILDVGYGNGSFLKVASSLYRECYGSDLNNDYPLPPKCKFVSDINSQQVDVITFFDSLEHIDNIDFVEHLNCKAICISLPWCHYLGDAWFTQWKHRKPDEHLHHFNDTSLRLYMSRMGYSCVNISNVEDSIRTPVDAYANILTGFFIKNKK